MKSDIIVLLEAFLKAQFTCSDVGCVWFLDIRIGGIFGSIYVHNDLNRLDILIKTTLQGQPSFEIAFAFNHCRLDFDSVLLVGDNHGHLRLKKTSNGQLEICTFNGMCKGNGGQAT